MKIGILSDIHANAQALRRALTDMPSVEHVLCGGDAISEYLFCPETVALLQQAHVQCIQGNHEWVLFGGRNPRYLEKCRAEYGADLLKVLAQAPESLELEFDGVRILMVHASPWRPYDEYVMPGSPQLARFAELPYDYVLLGHTHVPMVHQAGNVTVINPGSCGQPRDGDDRGAYAILDLAQQTVVHHRFSLD